MGTGRRLRILVVMNQLSRGYAGGDFHAVQVLNRWSRVHDVEVLLPDQSGTELADLISPRVRFRRPGSGPPPSSTWRLLQRYLRLTLSTTAYVWRRRRRWDVLVASSHYPFDVIPVLAAGPATLPVVYWHHHFSARSGRPAWLRALLRFVEGATARALSSRRALVFTVSHRTRDLLLQTGLGGEQVVMTTNGSSLTTAGGLRESERRLLETLNGRRYVLYCARISRLKGSEELRALVPAVLEADPDALFVIAGDGPDAAGLRGDFETELESGRVLMPGFVSERAKTLLFRGARLVVAPSYEEGWGITVCDALACGRPVIAYALPAVQDAFPRGPVYVPVGDVDALVESARMSLRSPVETAGVADSFSSWDRIAAQELEALGAAASRISSPAPEPLERVFLLTSHPVAPPWNSGDKNYARSLVVAARGVSYTYLTDAGEQVGEPGRHAPFTVPGPSWMWEGSIPTRREKVRVYLGLLLRRPSVDLVHVVMTLQGGVLPERALIAVPWLRAHPLVVTCLTSSYLPMHLLRRARAVVTISEHTRRRLAAAGLPDVRCIAPGVDLERWVPRDAEACQSALGLPPGRYLLFAGHHDPDGGLEQALRTLAALRPAVPDLRLLLAMRSRPGQDSSRLAAGLRRLAGALGVADAVVDLGPHADMPLAIGAATAVLFQALSLRWKMELPLVLIEALASGRPVVTGAVEPLAELGNGTPAVLTASAAAGEEVAAHLARLCRDRDYLATCSSEARRLAVERHDVRHMAARYAELYHSLAPARDEARVLGLE